MNPCQRASNRVLEACQILSPARRVMVRRPLGMSLACPPAAPCHAVRRLIFEKRVQALLTYRQLSMTKRHAARRPPSGDHGPPAVSCRPVSSVRRPPSGDMMPCHVTPSAVIRPPSGDHGPPLCHAVSVTEYKDIGPSAVVL